MRLSIYILTIWPASATGKIKVSTHDAAMKEERFDGLCSVNSRGIWTGVEIYSPNGLILYQAAHVWKS